MRYAIYISLLALACTIAVSCERPVDIVIPPGLVQVVVEGRVEEGFPPVVLLSTTRGFFEPVSAADVAASYIDEAEVWVNDVPMTRICATDIPPNLMPIFTELTGLSVFDPESFPICAWVGTDESLWGQANTTYRLRVETLGRVITSTAHIPHKVKPDSVWFRLWANSNRFGYCFANFTDPDTLGNSYRAFTRRIGPNLNDNPIDPVYYSPLGGVFADDFFNGTTVEVGFVRGQPPNSSRPTDQGESARFFEIGDKFVLKFCSTDQGTYHFFRTLEAQQGANGTPFAAPNNVISNIDGGIGVWAAYICSFDTIIAAP